MICIYLKKNCFLFYRYSCSENRQAYRTMASKYDADIIGQVMEGIVEFHKSQEVLYTLDEEAESVFEVITDKLNDQFNLKYTSASQISASQPDLDNTEKSELSVRTKATEIIGRLTCVLWVYCKGSILCEVLEVIILNNYETYKYILHLLNSLQCILHAKPLNIPREITAEYVRFAEEIADISYSQSETFSSVSILKK